MKLTLSNVKELKYASLNASAGIGLNRSPNSTKR